MCGVFFFCADADDARDVRPVAPLMLWRRARIGARLTAYEMINLISCDDAMKIKMSIQVKCQTFKINLPFLASTQPPRRQLMLLTCSDVGTHHRASTPASRTAYQLLCWYKILKPREGPFAIFSTLKLFSMKYSRFLDWRSPMLTDQENTYLRTYRPLDLNPAHGFCCNWIQELPSRLLWLQ